MPIVSLENLLRSGDSDSLDNLVKKARHMGELTHILQCALDPALAPSLKAANVREDGELVIVCESSAWAARLRYEADTMLKAARDAGLTVTSCKVSITTGV
jgi:hypothetical protein